MSVVLFFNKYYEHWVHNNQINSKLQLYSYDDTYSHEYINRKTLR